MSFDEVDPILQRWAKENEIMILAEDVAPNRRYFYISSPAGETFQIVIEPPQGTDVRIDAHLIETRDDEEIHDIYEARADSLQATLDQIMQRIKNWFDRQ
jgi:protein-tyrosine-phosphatase